MQEVNQLKPARDIVLIKVDPPKSQTASGLYIQEDWKTLPPVGTVEAIGPQVTFVKPGDRIIFERYASIILKDDRRLCKESHILATVDDDAQTN